jgi:predicted nucleic acid-binding protein
MVVFDANFLIYFLDSKVKGGVGANPRVDHLVATIQKTGERIVVPTPALCELLVGAAEAGPAFLAIIARSKYFRIAEFGTRAAVEAAALQRDAKLKGVKRGTTPGADWGKVKFDRQILPLQEWLVRRRSTRTMDNWQRMPTMSALTRSVSIICQSRQSRHNSK